MKLYLKLKYAVKVFLKSQNKKKLLKKSLCALKKNGIVELKQVIKEAGQTQESVIALYEKQQSIKKEYKEYASGVLFVIWAMHDEVDICDTYRLTIMQMKPQDRLVVIKGVQEADWEKRIDCEKMVCDRYDVYTCIQNLLAGCGQDYVYIIKGGNFLAANMRNEFAEMIGVSQPDIIFSDECAFAFNDGRIVRYDVKPDFSVYDLLQGNQSWQSVMYTRTVIEKSIKKGMPTGCMENMMFYIMVNAAEKTKKIAHIQQVMLLKKDILEEEDLEERRWIVEQCLKKNKTPVNVVIKNNQLKLYSYYGQRKVSIIILANQFEQAQKCIKNILNCTANVNYELLVVGEPALVERLKKCSIVRSLVTFVPCIKEMAYTQRCNKAAREASGDVLIFMQEDMRMNHAEWLSKLLDAFVFSWVGAVSPKIIRQDNTIRYAGMIAGGFGFTPVPFNGEANQYLNNVNEPAFLNRQVSVLSASCIAVSREAFELAGKFDEKKFEDKFSNAQLSFAISRAGYTCVYCADSVLMSTGQDWYDSWYAKEHPFAYINLLMNYGGELSEDAYFTESMKYLYLRGVPIDFRIHEKKKPEQLEKRILMVSHDSLLGGATIAFQYATMALKKCGYYVTWLVECEGPMLDELEKNEIGYIIDPSFKGSDGWLNYAKNFDLIICSTILLCPQVEKLKNIGKNVTWWVHEAENYYTEEIISSFTKKNLGYLHVWCGGSFAEMIFKKHFEDIPTEIMVYGIPDYAKKSNVFTENIICNPKNKVIFLSIGTIESRKGQDILAEAILQIEPTVREQCLFVFLGRPVQQKIYMKVQSVARKYPQSVTLKGPVDRNTLMQIYHQGDVVICTSREDPMPVFMTECLMQSRVAICSENTGTAGVLTDGYDGFIYHNNSVSELAQKITYVLKNRERMHRIRKNARRTYEDNFSMEIFEKRLQTCVGKILKE